MNISTVQTLRAHAISHSLFSPTTLRDAAKRLKFVQADPIRSPARAQDLILRHRVEHYRAGDLEREYPTLDLEEDVLYAYGFLTRDVWQLLHPRKTNDLTEFERNILETVARFGETHLRQLEDKFGRERVINAWGGFSQATTRALEKLHHCGLLRVARRAEGIRIYEAKTTAPPQASDDTGESGERLKKLIVVISNIFAPVTERCLREASAPLRRSLPQQFNIKTMIVELLKSGELEKLTVDGIDYLYPSASLIQCEVPQGVRLLAPFDPLVWDRRRFEHLWVWMYRFEAYTPPAKRLRGYYALPMLWRDSIIGWANVRVEKRVMSVEFGFVDKKPDDLDFSSELEKEINRLEIFLNLKNLSGAK
jgi:uncharacterized protein